MRSRIQISNGTIFKSEVIQTLHLGVAHIIDRRGLSVLCSFLALFCLLFVVTFVELTRAWLSGCHYQPPIPSATLVIGMTHASLSLVAR